MSTNRARPGHWISVSQAHWTKSNEAISSGPREAERACAEAARRDRERHERGEPDEHGEESADVSFRLIDSFELHPVPHGVGRVRVLVVERVRRARELPSDAKLAKLVAQYGLTPREAEVARALARRESSAEIAAALGISVNTARRHSERVLEKLGVRSRREIGELLRRCDEGG